MARKTIHEDLHLGSRGQKRSLRLYGPTGLEEEAYVQLEAPEGDFPGVTYRLPAAPVRGAFLSVDETGAMSWSARHQHTMEDIIGSGSGGPTYGKVILTLTELSVPLVGVRCVFTDANGIAQSSILTDTNGTAQQVLASGVYSLEVFLAVGWTIDTYTIDDTNSGNDSLANRVISGIDVAMTDVTLNIAAVVANAPVLTSVTINDGDQYASNTALKVSLDLAGVASQYMIAETPEFYGAQWKAYTGPILTYVKEYVSDILVTLYVKLKNSKGTTKVKSDSITMSQPFLRSDNAQKYSTLALAIADVVADYPGGLTQDVTLTCVGTFQETRSAAPYGIEIKSWNSGSAFILAIDGGHRFTYDCDSLGGIKIAQGGSIIIRDMAFVNVGSEASHSAPEELAGVMVQSIGTAKTDNIAIISCSFDGRHIYNGAPYYGDFAVIAYHAENVSVVGCAFSGSRSAPVKINHVGAMTIRKNIFSTLRAGERTISQPATLWAMDFEYALICDNDFDGQTMDSGCILTGSYIEILRNHFYNYGSDVLRVNSMTPGKKLVIDSNLFHDNLIDPRYAWTKNDILVSSNFQYVSLSNNTIRMEGVGRRLFFENFIRTNNVVVGEFHRHNNIVIFNFPDFPDNRSEAVFDAVSAIVRHSSNNIYRDNCTDGNTLVNYIGLGVEPGDGKKLSYFAAMGQEVDSKAFHLTDLILDSAWKVTDLFKDLIPANPAYLHAIGQDYMGAGLTQNAGAIFYQGAEVDEGATAVVATLEDALTNAVFEAADSPVTFNSESLFFTHIASPNRLLVPVLRFSFASGDILKIGAHTVSRLYSLLTPGGLYDGDLEYALGYLQDTLMQVIVTQKLTAARFVASDYFPLVGDTVALTNLSEESDQNQWTLNTGSEVLGATTVDASVTIAAKADLEQSLQTSNNVASSSDTQTLYVTDDPDMAYSMVAIDRECARVGDTVTITAQKLNTIAGATYAFTMTDNTGAQVASHTGDTWNYLCTGIGCFDISLEASVGGVTCANTQKKLLTVTPALRQTPDAIITVNACASASDRTNYDAPGTLPGAILVVRLQDNPPENAQYRLTLANLCGTAQQPIVVTIDQQTPMQFPFLSYYGLSFYQCRHVIFDGKGYHDLDHGLHITVLPDQANAVTGIAIGEGCSDIQVFGVEVSRCQFAGIQAKTDPAWNKPQYWRGAYTFYNLWLHHLYIHDTAAEGMYLGYFNTDTMEHWEGNTLYSYRAHELYDTTIYRNRFLRTGWDSIQLNNSTGMTEICYNLIEQAAFFPETDQASFMSLSLSGMVYNNRCIGSGGLGFQFGPLGDVKIFNNILSDMAYGYVPFLILTSTKTPEQAPDIGSEANTRITIDIFNNTVLATAGLVNARNVVDLPKVFIKNNLYKATGPIYSGQTPAILLQWTNQAQGNLEITDPDTGGRKIASVANNDFNIAPDSSAAKGGVDIAGTVDFDIRGFHDWYSGSKFTGAYAAVRKLMGQTVTLGDIDINGSEDGVVVTSLEVSVSMEYGGVPSHHMLSESPDFTGASWQPFTNPAPFTLSGGDGTKTVYAKIKSSSGSESATKSATCALETSVTMWVDFGRINTAGYDPPTASPNCWNKLGATADGSELPIGTTTAEASLKNKFGNLTGITLATLALCNVHTQGGNGEASPYPSYTRFPQPCVRDGIRVAYATPGSLRLSGLNAAKKYDIHLLGSRFSNQNKTRFTVQGVTQILNTQNNVTVTCDFNNLSPDAGGIIDIAWAGDNTYTNNYGHLNVLELIEHL
jgi:hypothetical protein